MNPCMACQSMILENVFQVFSKIQKSIKQKVIGLSGDYLKLDDYVEIMNKQLAPNKFIISKMSIEKLSSFKFSGVEYLAAMFDYYQTGKMKPDIELSRILNKNLLNF